MKIGDNTFSSIAYGPIHSRRLGTSLGINLMPDQHKICSFNCVYCECGWNPGAESAASTRLPSREQVRDAIEAKLIALAEEGTTLDVITFSGNGEPTLHPEFLPIIMDTVVLRDQYCPSAKISVLSNSTQLGRDQVVRALKLADNRILKLDAATDEMMHRIDLPVNEDLTVAQIMEWLRAFDGDFTLQTCFLRGTFETPKTSETLGTTQIIDNTTPDQLQAWYDAIDVLRPKSIMIYVIDRKTPLDTLEKLTRDEMEAIAAPLRAKGYNVSVSA